MPTQIIYGRKATQQRSKQTQKKIVLAASEIVAELGFVGLTHRLVAKRAGVSLAATTYYYKTKADIIADISNHLIGLYDEDTRNFHDDSKNNSNSQNYILNLLSRLLASRQAEVITWMELIFEASRQSNDVTLAQSWMSRFNSLEAEIAKHCQASDVANDEHSKIDMSIGLLIMTASLGLDELDINAVFFEGANPFIRWAKNNLEKTDIAENTSRVSAKAAATRQHILGATISVIIQQGASAVNFRLVAKLAKLTPAALAYHFSSPQQLLREAQKQLFIDSKNRYRAAMIEFDYQNMKIDDLTDMTSTVFIRESTEFHSLNLANYGIWLEASRVPELRPMVWSVIEDMASAWHRILLRLNADTPPLNAFLIQAVYIGKLIRISSLGCLTKDLALVRNEFLNELRNLIK